MNWFKRKPKSKPKMTNTPDQSGVPEGWMILEMGQSPAHGLWYCHMVQWDALFGDKKGKRVWCEEMETLDQAIQFCVDEIAKMESTDANETSPG